MGDILCTALSDSGVAVQSKCDRYSLAASARVPGCPYPMCAALPPARRDESCLRFEEIFSFSFVKNLKCCILRENVTF